MAITHLPIDTNALYTQFVPKQTTCRPPMALFPISWSRGGHFTPFGLSWCHGTPTLLVLSHLPTYSVLHHLHSHATPLEIFPRHDMDPLVFAEFKAIRLQMWRRGCSDQVQSEAWNACVKYETHIYIYIYIWCVCIYIYTFKKKKTWPASVSLYIYIYEFVLYIYIYVVRSSCIYIRATAMSMWTVKMSLFDWKALHTMWKACKLMSISPCSYQVLNLPINGFYCCQDYILYREPILS